MTNDYLLFTVQFDGLNTVYGCSGSNWALTIFLSSFQFTVYNKTVTGRPISTVTATKSTTNEPRKKNEDKINSYTFSKALEDVGVPIHCKNTPCRAYGTTSKFQNRHKPKIQLNNKKNNAALTMNTTLSFTVMISCTCKLYRLKDGHVILGRIWRLHFQGRRRRQKVAQNL